MVSIVPLQRRPEAPAASASARSIFSLERRRREEDDGSGPGGGMDLSGTQGELAIPMHANVASPYGGVGGVGGHVLQQLHGRDHGSNNNGQQSPAAAALTPSPPAAAEETESSGKKRGPAAGGIGGATSSAVKYRECLKNHAAAIGGNATDGCGEFMPSGEEGSLEALKCSACGCHRNFHRKEVDDDDDDDVYGAADGFSGLGLGHGHGHRAAHRLLAPAMAHPHHKSGGGLLISGADPYGAYAAARALPPALPPPPRHGHAHAHHQYVMPLNMMHTSESDEMEGGGGVAGDAARGGGSSSSRKRFRTKFTPEQKARMLEFAERVGWRLQRLDDGMVQAFCQEIGVKRRVLKVWMHNNKHNLATKRLEASPAAQEQQAMAGMASPPPPPPPQHMHLQMPAGVMPPPPQQQQQQAGPSCHRGGPGSPLPLKLE